MSDKLFDDIFMNMQVKFYQRPPAVKSIVEDDLGFHIDIKYHHNNKYYLVEYKINSHSRTQIAEMILEMIQMDDKAANEPNSTN